MNLARILFEDIISSRIEKNVLFFRFVGGWAMFRFFRSKEDQSRVLFKIKNGGLIQGNYPLDNFLKTLNNFLLRGDIEKVCRFLRNVNVQKNRGLKKDNKISRRGCNIAKEFILNFLLYRLSYEQRERTEVFLWENYYQFFQPGKFYLARRSSRLRKVLGGYIISLTYYLVNPLPGRPAPLRIHLPHLNIHQLVRDALINLGLRIN